MIAYGAETQAHIQELMDIVDDNDVVIGTMPRSQAYAENHRKRIAYIFAFTPEKGEVILAMRRKQVSWRPLHYAPTVGGHVMAGENAEQAAYREMQEEIGIKRDVLLIDKSLSTDPTNGQKYVESIFVVCADMDACILDPREVDHLEVMKLDVAQELIESGEVPCHPKLAHHLMILKQHWPAIKDKLQL